MCLARLPLVLLGLALIAGTAQAADPSGSAQPAGNPSVMEAMNPDARGYLSEDTLPDIRHWLPAAPAPKSAAERADLDAYTRSRALLAGPSPRGQMAAEDDVYDPADILLRFHDALGLTLNADNAPTLVRLLQTAQRDARLLVAPVKQRVPKGGRVRPFAAHPKLASCLYPKDLAGRRAINEKFDLAGSGSYPSGHALQGMFVALVLTATDPAHADAALARGIAFGDSRLVCGFHYPSDLVAGRLAASVLFARLQAEPAFRDDLAAATREIAAARSAAAPPLH